MLEEKLPVGRRWNWSKGVGKSYGGFLLWGRSRMANLGSGEALLIASAEVHG